MNSTAIMISFICLLSAGFVEYAMHARRLRRIPIRVNVNGTRGKSTVTRLIAAGLREAGIPTVAKTTGTAPMIILPDGTEEKIRRHGRARISEHIGIVRRTVASGAKALVVECMALEPENQRVYERMLAKSTIGVITNIRPDHLDVMGPELDDVAEALSNTIAQKGEMVMVEGPYVGLMKSKCERNGARLSVVSGKEVSKEEVASFGYTSFPENVAIALKVCSLAGVERETALSGMLKAKPDPGVRPVTAVEAMGRKLLIIDAFAANDAVSTGMMWDDFVAPRRDAFDMAVVLLNNREDRPQRVGEMSALAAALPADRIFVAGKLQGLALRALKGARRRAIAVKTSDPKSILDKIAGEVPSGGSAVVFMAGNTKGIGSGLSEYIAEIGGGEAS